MNTKICGNPECRKEKHISQFCKDKHTKDGYTSYCRECKNKKNARYESKNKDKISNRKRKWRSLNREETKRRAAAYYQRNKEQYRQYYLNNKERFRERKTKYQLSRRKSDPIYAMICRERIRIRDALKGKTKPGHTLDLLDCTPEELRQHIESLFKPGMSWDNREQWHVDHILPISLFNLEDPIQANIVFYYKNLQPLWAEENLKKGDSHNLNDYEMAVIGMWHDLYYFRSKSKQQSGRSEKSNEHYPNRPADQSKGKM